MMAQRTLKVIVLFLVGSCHARAIFSPLDPRISRRSSHAANVEVSLQGGAARAKVPGKKGKQQVAAASKQQQEVDTTAFVARKNAAIVIATATTSYALWVYRTSWMGLFNKERLMEKTLEILHHLDSKPKLVSYSVYMLGMAFWEAVGFSTIPIETASGMVFGWQGFYLSAIGKLLGALVAFCLTRYGVLAAAVHEKFSKNQVLKLLEDSAESHPLRVAILLKLSCFPETIKNYGSALLQPIRLWMFIFGTVGHGWTFSALWTYLGVDTAKRLADTTLPVDGKLQILLTLAIVNGVVVSPLAMAVWLKSLKRPAEPKPKKRLLAWRPNK